MTGYVASGDNAKALELWKKYGEGARAARRARLLRCHAGAFNVHRGFPPLRRALIPTAKRIAPITRFDGVVAVFEMPVEDQVGQAVHQRPGAAAANFASAPSPANAAAGLPCVASACDCSSGYRSSASCPPNMSWKRCGCARRSERTLRRARALNGSPGPCPGRRTLGGERREKRIAVREMAGALCETPARRAASRTLSPASPSFSISLPAAARTDARRSP